MPLIRRHFDELTRLVQKKKDGAAGGSCMVLDRSDRCVKTQMGFPTGDGSKPFKTYNSILFPYDWRILEE